MLMSYFEINSEAFHLIVKRLKLREGKGKRRKAKGERGSFE